MRKQIHSNNRKYSYYELAASNQEQQTFENYREAFSAFNAARNDNDHATLYGIDEIGDITIINAF